MKLLICPDKFKDALDAPAAADAMAAGARDVQSDAEIDLCPLADGGEGSGPILASALAAVRQTCPVLDPLGRSRQADWWRQPKSKTAIIEMAEASGLHLLAPRERDAAQTSSFGTGQLIRAAIEAGCQRITLCVGGSATVDGGAGCLEALGWNLIDRNGNALTAAASGADLTNICRIEPPSRPIEASITILCDVDNPLLGSRGAAPVFAPQKGARREDVEQLAAALEHWASLLEAATGRDVRNLTSAGAAGGLPAGLAAACNATLRPGFEHIAAMVNLRARMARCDLCLTGEGRIDEQTVAGKTVAGVATLARQAGVPIVALVGCVDVAQGGSADRLSRMIGLSEIIPITPSNMTVEDAMPRTRALLRAAASKFISSYGAS